MTRTRLEERRLHFLELLETQAHSTQELSEFLGVKASTISTWRHRLRH
ncbi:helix-turn-helix domain-containing protein [Deinococcus alpinitundrae]